MNTDRELLELAAKAARLTVRWHENGYYGPTMEIMEDESGGPPWNPLTDDGDALRLAVKLHLILVMTPSDFIVADWYSKHEAIEEPITDDRNSATRRAIVRAAAEIGKRMSVKNKS